MCIYYSDQWYSIFNHHDRYNALLTAMSIWLGYHSWVTPGLVPSLAPPPWGIKSSEITYLENYLAILLPWWTTLNLAKSFLVTTPTTSLLSLHTSMCRWNKLIKYEVRKYTLTKPNARNLLKIWGKGVEARMIEGVGFITGLKSMW